MYEEEEDDEEILTGYGESYDSDALHDAYRDEVSLAVQDAVSQQDHDWIVDKYGRGALRYIPKKFGGLA